MGETLKTSDSHIPVLVGPTASGKTKLVLQLLQDNPDLRIVLVDSRKIYRELEIGINKPPKSYRHLFRMVDLIPIDMAYNAMDFAMRAEKEILNLLNKGHSVLVVGGTPMYLYALFHGLFIAPKPDPELRKNLLNRIKSGENLYEELKRVDPITASSINPNDWVRITRALEVYYQTGTPISVLRAKYKVNPRFKPVFVGLQVPRPTILKKIEDRVLNMIDAGLVEETKELLKRYPPDSPGFRTIGYQETIEFLQGNMSLSELVRKITRNTKTYMRRQLHFFRKLGSIDWLPEEKIRESLSTLIKSKKTP